jgi:hypothetical protein
MGRRAQQLNAIQMFGMAAMRKIHSRYVHAGFEQPLQNSRIARSRTDRADDFGMSKTHRDNQKAKWRDSSLRPEWRLETFSE